MLESLPPSALPKIFRLNLATELMVEIVHAAGQAEGKSEAAAERLEALATVPRFSMVVAFMVSLSPSLSPSLPTTHPPHPTRAKSKQ